MVFFDIHSQINELQDYLTNKSWLLPEEQIDTITKPGDGNMNVVLRVQTNQRSFILKQSRPFVQKYQEIEAPLDRIAVEHQFYTTIQNDAIAQHLPAILNYSSEDYLMMLQDLGHCEDMTYTYDQRSISNTAIEILVKVLAAIHQTKAPIGFPTNLALRKLNHQHIFVLPFLEDNGFQLDDIQKGLQQLSLPYKKDSVLAGKVTEVGNNYLSNGSVLLHGDYYPGSWMTERDQLYVIDPEFSFMGFAEFDLGVMIAHAVMASMNKSPIDLVFEKYPLTIDQTLTKQVAGIEIMRRLIGLAQLPLKRTLEEKHYLLRLAHKMILP